MKWNWQEENWPNFSWDDRKLSQNEILFAYEAGQVVASLRHLSAAERKSFSVDVMIREALETSAIEGEYLNRESIRTSLQRQLGFPVDISKVPPKERGISEMMADLYHNIEKPLSHKTLFKWHVMLLRERHDLKDIGHYRTGESPMQIVSGADYARKVHYEAPPSDQVMKEMEQFIGWFNQMQCDGLINCVTRAGIAHLWFESIHPFEDGNGRIGRAIAEKILVQDPVMPTLVGLASILRKRHKDYYRALERGSQGLEITDWLLWFGSIVIEAQKWTQTQVEFILAKAKLMEKARGQINPRQEKVLLRMFQEGTEGFRGGLSAKNYVIITGAPSATTTRDLADLVAKGILFRTGELKSARYHLKVDQSSYR